MSVLSRLMRVCNDCLMQCFAWFAVCNLWHCFALCVFVTIAQGNVLHCLLNATGSTVIVRLLDAEVNTECLLKCSIVRSRRS